MYVYIYADVPECVFIKWPLKGISFVDVLIIQDHSNILLLTGPAGAGKSATIDVLKRDLNFEVQEWSMPVTNTSEGNEIPDVKRSDLMIMTISFLS